MRTTEIVVPEGKPAFEWVRGRALQKMSPSRKHSMLQRAFAFLLYEWAAGRGWIGTEWRFRVTPPGEEQRPLVPDVAYIAADRLATVSEVEARVSAARARHRRRDPLAGRSRHRRRSQTRRLPGRGRDAGPDRRSAGADDAGSLTARSRARPLRRRDLHHAARSRPRDRPADDVRTHGRAVNESSLRQRLGRSWKWSTIDQSERVETIDSAALVAVETPEVRLSRHDPSGRRIARGRAARSERRSPASFRRPDRDWIRRLHASDIWPCRCRCRRRRFRGTRPPAESPASRTSIPPDRTALRRFRRSGRRH